MLDKIKSDAFITKTRYKNRNQNAKMVLVLSVSQYCQKSKLESGKYNKTSSSYSAIRSM
jgi:hypothetical protein